MLKKMIMSGIIIVLLSVIGCNNQNKEDTVQDNEMITEIHEITLIKGYEVYGENITGKGEGIFYYEGELKNAGIQDIKVGDKIQFSWSKDDFYNENWRNFKAKKVD